jgi:hypothetical protein
MNNEPVAWMEYIQGEEWEVWFTEPTDLPKGHTYKPLYTHPAKTLTDEEIISLINKHIDYVPDGDGMKIVGVMDFAKAILRKAQEK